MWNGTIFSVISIVIPCLYSSGSFVVVVFALNIVKNRVFSTVRCFCCGFCCLMWSAYIFYSFTSSHIFAVDIQIQLVIVVVDDYDEILSISCEFSCCLFIWVYILVLFVCLFIFAYIDTRAPLCVMGCIFERPSLETRGKCPFVYVYCCFINSMSQQRMLSLSQSICLSTFIVLILLSLVFNLCFCWFLRLYIVFISHNFLFVCVCVLIYLYWLHINIIYL